MTSPLGTIVDALKQVRQNANAYGPRLAKNEAATRSALIDPVLKALGWDLGNPFMVEFERSFLDTRVDYALFNCQDQVKVIVEAKTLGGNLSDKKILMSLLTYAFTYGLQDIFLTDGLIWEHFYDFQPGKVAANRTLDLSKDDLVDCAEYFVSRLDTAKYWPESKETKPVPISVSVKQVEELTKNFIALQAELAELKSRLSEEPKPTPKNDPPPENPKPDAGFTNLNELPTQLKGLIAPGILRLPDGSIRTVKSWSSILKECAKFALALKTDFQLPLPDNAGKKVALLNTVQPSNKNIRYEAVEYNGRTVYLYLNYDSNGCIENAIYILSFVSPEHFQVPAAVQGMFQK